jgi:FkbM family methyltransferase
LFADVTTEVLLAYGCRMPNHLGKWWIHSRIRDLFKIKPSGERRVVRSGKIWFLDPADYVQADLFWFGVKDTWELHHIRRILRPGGVFLDLGANFGFYSIILASELQLTAWAFEPHGPTYNRLVRHVAANGLGNVIKPQRVALSNTTGFADTKERPANTGATSVVVTSTGNVPVDTLDEFCDRHDIRPDFIKVDVEGFEYRVLEGAREILTRWRPPILIELNPPVLREQNTSVEEVVDRLRCHDYQLYRVCKRRLRPLDSVYQQDPEDYLNVFCLPPGS